MRLEAWVLAASLALAGGGAPASAQSKPKGARAPRSGAAPAPPAAHGQLDKHSSKALQQTQDMLRDPKSRQEAIRGDARAEAANRRAEALGGSPQNTQRIYDISADVLVGVTERGGGDPARMTQILEAAQRDPAAFLRSLPPEQRAAIQQLAADLAKSNPDLAGQKTP